MKFSYIIFLILLSKAGNTQETATLLKNGNEFYQKKEFSKAIEQYRIAVKKNPDNSMLLFNLGNALYKSGNLDEASKAFEKTA